MKKRISIDDLKPGMRVVGLDQSWMQSPLWFHRQVINCEGDIMTLRRSGVREVDVDEMAGPSETPVTMGGIPVDSFTQVAFPAPNAHSGTGTMVDNGRHLHTHEAQTEHAVSPPDQFDAKLQAAREIRMEAISAVEQVFEGIKTGVALQSNSLVPVTQTLLGSLLDDASSMLAEIQLQRIKQYDRSLYAHSVDVCVMALMVGYEGQLPDDQLRVLAMGALLHDVGQVRLPRNLLTKCGTFTPGERQLYQSHPKLGATIISESEGMPAGVQRIVSEHHERINGEGFPWKRSGAAISTLAQLVGIIDRYDALIRSRGGRPPLPPTLAIRRMYQSALDGEFSLEWVERLIKSFGLYPVGSLVELNSGERGWVIDVNQADSMCPTVKILWGPGQVPLPESRVIELIHEPTDGGKPRIQRVLNPTEVGCAPSYTLEE